MGFVSCSLGAFVMLYICKRRCKATPTVYFDQKNESCELKDNSTYKTIKKFENTEKLLL